MYEPIKLKTVSAFSTISLPLYILSGFNLNALKRSPAFKTLAFLPRLIVDVMGPFPYAAKIPFQLTYTHFYFPILTF